MSNRRTNEITVPEGVIVVETLPKEIRDDVDFFDKMANDIDELRYKLNVLIVASSGMKNKIIQEAAKWVRDNAPSESAMSHNGNESETNMSDE